MRRRSQTLPTTNTINRPTQTETQFRNQLLCSLCSKIDRTHCDKANAMAQTHQPCWRSCTLRAWVLASCSSGRRPSKRCEPQTTRAPAGDPAVACSVQRAARHRQSTGYERATGLSGTVITCAVVALLSQK